MIYKSVVLRCDPARAFALFTEHAGDWWPADRRHTGDVESTIRIEASGRFFERASDGSEVDLGVVRLFQPPERLVLDWYPGTGHNDPTRVDVRFQADEHGTRVSVTHDAGATTPERFAGNAPAYARSWDSVLACLLVTPTLP
jgi:uncharacterized protein YndB with AHSA1/START domain